jgi:tetratricopeptide (TPR) repeat protein
MALLSAEQNYREGLVALVEGRPETARDLFRSAVEDERRRGVAYPQMRYLSYYGLALAQSDGSLKEALEACRTAVRTETVNANLFLNLGKVEFLAGHVREAILAFQRGLDLEPRHQALLVAMETADRRQRQGHSLWNTSKSSRGNGGGNDAAYPFTAGWWSGY